MMAISGEVMLEPELGLAMTLNSVAPPVLDWTLIRDPVEVRLLHALPTFFCHL